MMDSLDLFSFLKTRKVARRSQIEVHSLAPKKSISPLNGVWNRQYGCGQD
jgi:hypothetical protein